METCKADEKYRVLQPFLEREMPLAQIARSSQFPLRTLQGWAQRYRAEGYTGLERRKRADAGTRRGGIPPELIALVEALALQKPALPITVIHRKAATIAKEKQWRALPYHVVYHIVTQLDPALTTLALEGNKAYRNKYELIYRRESNAPNEMWQADHTPLDILVMTEKGGMAKPWLTVDKIMVLRHFW